MTAIVKLGDAHVVITLDASPSMQHDGYADPAIRGVNDQVQALRETSATRTLVSLLQFDRNVRPTYTGEDLGKVPRLTRAEYSPGRGDGTALYDGVHAAIDLLEPEVKDNETALVVVVTDGEENASHMFGGDVAQLAARVTKKRLTGRWTFVLLGPKRSAYRTAEQIGIPVGNVRTFAGARELGASFEDTRRSIGRYMDERARGIAASEDFYLPPKTGQ